MIGFRDHNNWLRHRVNSTIRNKHNELFESKWKSYLNNCLNYTFDRERWWLILLIITSFFILTAIIDWDLLNFLDIKHETAKTIIDHRTTNVAAIVSMTLAVVGFLISNLAVKESFAYRLLFKNSRLYPIIYFTLGTIGSLIVVSTLRDAIKSDHVFSKLVITGTYFVLIVLFLIGYLFRTIIHFTNSKRIQLLLHEELIVEARSNIKEGLIKKYSREQYGLFMEKIGLKKYDWAEAWGSAEINFEAIEFIEDESPQKEIKEKIVKDINLVGISVLISPKKSTEKIYYRELALNISTPESDNYIWVNGVQNTEREREKLKKCLILKNKPKKEKDTTIVRKYFDQKLEELTDESKYRNLEDLLQSYIILYELQMKHQS